jgi:tRNA A37 threonylcarbamoyladenosine biosynthesis protein TsaE
MIMRRIEIDSLSDLERVADEVIEALDGRTVVLLRGGMGAG